VVPALREATNLIVGGHVSCIIVAAVDSLIRQDLAKYYLSKKRLLTPKNSNGFAMGEAGSAVLVTSDDAGPEGQLRILGMGMGREKAAIESEEPLRAEGLIQAIREAFRDGGVTYDDVQYRITDLNGEHYKFKEMVLAMMRFQRKPKPKLFDLWHPIEYIGDVGAAIGPLILGLALHAGQKGYSVGPGVLCTLGNDEGERAALVVRYEVAGEAR
jgi:3-oxoacyl-[acyl-carrier-protein] synthase I